MPTQARTSSGFYRATYAGHKGSFAGLERVTVNPIIDVHYHAISDTRSDIA